MNPKRHETNIVALFCSQTTPYYYFSISIIISFIILGCRCSTIAASRRHHQHDASVLPPPQEMLRRRHHQHDESVVLPPPYPFYIFYHYVCIELLYCRSIVCSEIVLTLRALLRRSFGVIFTPGSCSMGGNSLVEIEAADRSASVLFLLFLLVFAFPLRIAARRFLPSVNHKYSQIHTQIKTPRSTKEPLLRQKDNRQQDFI